MAAQVEQRVRIAVILPSLGLRDGEILRGVRAYAPPNKRWWLQVVGASLREVETMREWGADGALGVLRDRKLAAEVVSWRKPVVNVSNTLSPGDLDLPRVSGDDVAVGEMAAEYFLERGFRNFAMFEEPGFWWSECRRKGYETTLRANGFGCVVGSDPRERNPGRRAPSLRREHDKIIRWAKSLPAPTALFVVNDYRARELLEIFFAAGIGVPSELAVVGVENDATVCEIAFPPLSSVATEPRRIGYEAAATLDELLSGRKLQQKQRFLAPAGVVTRQSSELLATPDQDVQAAVRFIRASAHRPIHVEDVLEHVPISRRQLERRFATALGSSVLDAIHVARIDHAKRQLIDTDLPMSRIWTRCGFASPQRFNSAFRRLTGLTPTRYRRQFRLGG